MRDYISIGPTPCDESCAQVGEPNYRQKALAECARFIRLLRHTFGSEPAGAQLSIKWFSHDFGSYCEVVCSYDTDMPASRDYACRCESETPATWEEDDVPTQDQGCPDSQTLLSGPARGQENDPRPERDAGRVSDRRTGTPTLRAAVDTVPTQSGGGETQRARTPTHDARVPRRRQ